MLIYNQKSFTKCVFEVENACLCGEREEGEKEEDKEANVAVLMFFSSCFCLISVLMAALLALSVAILTAFSLLSSGQRLTCTSWYFLKSCFNFHLMRSVEKIQTQMCTLCPN